MKRKAILISWALAVLLLAACEPVDNVPDPSSQDAASLSGTEWALVRLHDREPLQGAEVTLSFADTTAGGVSGCNNYGCDYTAAADGSLSFGEIQQTLILCTEPEGVMELELEYIDSLRLADSYRVAEDRLVISDQAGNTILEYVRE